MLRRTLPAFSFLCVAMFGQLLPAVGQTCVDQRSILNLACAPNPYPHSVSTALGGAVIVPSECKQNFAKAVASLFAYDDPTCHTVNSRIDSQINFIADATGFLPPYEKLEALDDDLRGSLYCDSESGTLILAYKGSSQIPKRGGYTDWAANLLQHFGYRPLQYEYSLDVADQIKERLGSGNFDGSCGSGRPNLVLTGHSKGGGQAQFAAVGLGLEAVVFNSDLVNPVIFSDWALQPGSDNEAGQPVKCFPARIHPYLRYYYSSGRIKDIRMVNDPLVNLLLGCTLPHSEIEWLIDTSTCSVADGHGIGTVIRELQKTCASR